MFSIICVTWKNEKQLKELLESINKYSCYDDHEVIVYHNECDKEWYKRSSFIFHIRSIENIGLSKAANEASKLARQDYVCLVDDDMILFQDWDLRLLGALKKHGQNWVSSTMIENPAPPYNMTQEQFANDHKQPWYHNISNCPLLIPRKFWEKIGGYDTDFPVIGAELGLAKRAYDAGERLFLQVPTSLVFHKQSQSINRMKDKKQQQVNRDRIFLEKYGITRKAFVKLIKKGEVYDPTF